MLLQGVSRRIAESNPAKAKLNTRNPVKHIWYETKIEVYLQTNQFILLLFD
jgi:hypothetical protein